MASGAEKQAAFSIGKMSTPTCCFKSSYASYILVMIRTIAIKLKYFHSCLTSYLKAYTKQQVLVEISLYKCKFQYLEINNVIIAELWGYGLQIYTILFFLYTDADECSDGTSLCAYGCENTPPGSFTCTCPNGLTLSQNGFSCLGEHTDL